MIKNTDLKISSKSAATIIFFLAKGCFLGIATYNIFNLARVSSYISVIIGLILSIIPFSMIMYILKYGEGKNIIETIEIIFGKKVGKIINIIISIFFFLFSSILLYNFISFIDINYMPETSKMYIALFLVMAFSYIISKGLNTFAKASQIIFYISIFTLTVSIFGMASEIDVTNLLPVFTEEKSNIFLSSLNIIIFNALPCFLITLIGKNMVDDENNYIKDCYKMYAFEIIEVILFFILMLSVLGINLISINKYAEYFLLTKINILNLIKRVQNIVALQLSYNIVLLILMSLMYSYNNFERYLKKEKSKSYLQFSIAFLSVVFSFCIFKDMVHANYFYYNYLPVILGAFLSGVVLIIFLKLLIKNIKEKKR